MMRRPAGTGLEDYADAARRIREDVVRRLNRADVSVTVTNHDETTPTPRNPDQVFVYSDDSLTIQSLGTPLVLTLTCEDPAAWPSIDRTMRVAGFLPFGPRSTLGNQAYQSATRAWFVVPVNPGATRAVDRVGKAVLGWNVAPVW
jgi:hypothetical protein